MSDLEELISEKANVFEIIGYTRALLSAAGFSEEEKNMFMKEVTSGDYKHACDICLKWAGLK